MTGSGPDPRCAMHIGESRDSGFALRAPRNDDAMRIEAHGYYVYILASRKDGATYVGITNDLVRRIYEHRTKAVRSFTSKYNITRLVWFEIYEDPISAISREKN